MEDKKNTEQITNKTHHATLINVLTNRMAAQANELIQQFDAPKAQE